MESVKPNVTPSLYFLLILVSSGSEVLVLSSQLQSQWWSWCVPLQNYFYLPYGDVKNIASNRAGYSHVPKPFPGHYDAGDQIRDGGPSSQDGQTHNLLTNANCLSNLKAMTGINIWVFVKPSKPQTSQHNSFLMIYSELCWVLKWATIITIELRTLRPKRLGMFT